LYKGYTIQPFSPAAGTGLSSHELNQPGCYRDVKDTTVTALFQVVRDAHSEFLFDPPSHRTPHTAHCTLHLMAWTTTPWTLPSNTALAVGAKIRYVAVDTFNPYSGDPVRVLLAKERLPAYFNPEHAGLPFEDYRKGDKKIPYRIIKELTGKELEGIHYHQLIDWVKPRGEAFRVITGDFVTTEDGTGIVHIAPTFGADDDRVAKSSGIPPLIVIDRDGKIQPLVDRKGRFYPVENLDPQFVTQYVQTGSYEKFAGRFVKNEYDANLKSGDDSTDVEIAVMLKNRGQVFKIEKLVHNYPHCWRTDKPVLYYPLDSWFIRTTAMKEELIRLNRTINWKPESTGTGRFGNWLENLVDWNLSRSRFWGTPLPIWRSEDGKSEICIGSVEELKNEIDRAVEAGVMKSNPLSGFIPGDNSRENYNRFDLHRPFVDEIILVDDEGRKLFREPDLIDVWFDSGAMPFAQLHYPFENKNELDHFFPADFISEGVDQTRGWFYTLHAIAVLLKDSVAYKNLVSHGLVLDKEGNKMSKRLGNTVDPFKVIDQFGSDALRWYMIANAPPWDNLKYDPSGVGEVKRKFFGTLYHTYAFFSLYANVDGFRYEEPDIPVNERPELDRWILSLLNSLIIRVDEFMDDYFPTRSARAIQEFVVENLSNWYVRLSRKRFWGSEYEQDKISAYQTLYTCLETLARLAAPFAPFYMDQLYTDLHAGTGHAAEESVHLTGYPKANIQIIDHDLEERMALAQSISSMVLGLRRKVNIKVRQPLSRIMVPVLNSSFKRQLQAVEEIIKTEINVKEIEYLTDTSGILVKKIKPNYKILGKKYGKLMKEVSGMISQFSQEDITRIETTGHYPLTLSSGDSDLLLEEVEILSEDIPGWLVANEGTLTIALDITLTDELRHEGIARELINRIQNLRKENGFEVTDKVIVKIKKHPLLHDAVNQFKSYIAHQTLAAELKLVEKNEGKEVEISDDIITNIEVLRI
ncbi:MAG: isoleucine--tRNA ligase, partial [Bacteroidales bacterium]|nr:isoleucine--tRNA ligase [Bacteroidales bacterium]